MKKLTLDYSTWRCGHDSEHSLGKGPTRLLNEKGFMCCLGQWGLQLLPKLSKNDVLHKISPASLQGVIPGLTTTNRHYIIKNTPFSVRAMLINDSSWTPQEKIKQLKALCLENNIELTVINQPIDGQGNKEQGV